jgi:hypothetical protein
MLAQQRVAVDTHAARWLKEEAPESTVRLERLHSSGLLHRQQIFEGQPAAITITRRGLAATGSALPAPRIDLRQYRHDVGVAWLWQAAHAGTFGAPRRVISEREMRSHDRRQERAPAIDRRPLLGVGIGGTGPGGYPLRHYADLLVDTVDDRRVAVELELTAKSRPRIDRVMLAFASDARIHDVVYLVPDQALARFVSDAAGRAGLRQMVHVHRVSNDGLEGAPAISERGALTHPAIAQALER